MSVVNQVLDSSKRCYFVGNKPRTQNISVGMVESKLGQIMYFSS